MGSEQSKKRTSDLEGVDSGVMPKGKKKNRKSKELPPPEEKEEGGDHSIEDQKQVGYIVDHSDTERLWNEKQEAKEEKKEEPAEEPPDEPDKEEKIKVVCKLCQVAWKPREVYSLETCGHTFCFECIKNFLVESIDVTVNDLPKCPKEKCDAPISISDLKKALETFKNEEAAELEFGEAEVDPMVAAIRQSVGVLSVNLSHSLELFVDQLDYLVKCPSCKLVFEKVPLSAADSRHSEKVYDEKGALVTGDAFTHYQENRFRCRNCTTIFCSQCYQSPYHVGYTCRTYLESLHKNKCRYCGEPVPVEYSFYTHEQQGETWVTRWKKRRAEKRKRAEITIDLNDKAAVNQFIEEREKNMEAAGEFYVCDEEECQVKATNACLHTTNCKHLCGGVRNEQVHLPCLKEDCVEDGDTTADDFCNICWVEDLASAPCVQLKCGHVFHFACIKTRIDRGYETPYISFKFASCPLCDAKVDHPMLDTKEIRELEAMVRDLGVRRLRAEMMLDDPEVQEGGEYYQREGDYAILRLAFYKCDGCKRPYYGGRKACDAGQEQAAEAAFNPKELICPACSGINANCNKHGQEFIEFKCRFCCSLATYFCGGKAHFCTPCHDKAGEKVDFGDWSTKWEGVIECPGFEKCPLGMPHPMNGEEACLGCSMCRAEG